MHACRSPTYNVHMTLHVHMYACVPLPHLFILDARLLLYEESAPPPLYPRCTSALSHTYTANVPLYPRCTASSRTPCSDPRVGHQEDRPPPAMCVCMLCVFVCMHLVKKIRPPHANGCHTWGLFACTSSPTVTPDEGIMLQQFY